MPRITRPQVYRAVREMLPRERFGPAELLRWLEETQECNERARLSHAKRRAALLNRRCNTSDEPMLSINFRFATASDLFFSLGGPIHLGNAVRLGILQWLNTRGLPIVRGNGWGHDAFRSPSGLISSGSLG